MAVLGLFAVLAAAMGARGALGIIGRLDRDISRLETDIVNSSYQIARRQSVEARYAQVARQHSSAWTESEIRDRLRQEIYRLGNRIPPGLDDDGIPLSTGGGEKLLVSIPELRGGRLEAGGEGYREYRMDFSVLPAPFLDMVAYLERLQESPQSLRIDRIDMRRDPSRPEVSAELSITRIVVDDSPDGAPAAALATAESRQDRIALLPSEWTCEGCEIILKADEGQGEELELRSPSGSARAFMERMLPAAGVYDVAVELASSSEGFLGVKAGEGLLPSTGEVALKTGPAYYRYCFQFSVPAGQGARVPVGFPVLAWQDADSVLKVRNLYVSHVAGEHDGV